MNWGSPMNNTPKNFSEADLDQLFSEMQNSTPAPSAELLARLTEDAEAVQTARHQEFQKPKPQKVSLWRSFTEAIGGWPAVAGLSLAGVTGIWLGAVPPEFLSTQIDILASASTSEDLSFTLVADLGLEFDLTEEGL